MALSFQFPHFRQVYTQASKFSFCYLKFQARYFLASTQIRQFERFINTHCAFQRYLNDERASAYPLLHTFMNKKWHINRRREAMQTDLTCALKLFGEPKLQALAEGKQIVLAKISDDLEIRLSRNLVCKDEGFWGLYLADGAGRWFYATTFAFLSEQKMLIGSMQGLNGEGAKEVVKTLTKKMFGLRPQQLMIIVLQHFAQQLGCQQLAAVTHDQQVKLRWKLRKRVHINYDEMWQSFQASLQADGYWHLPLQESRKAEANIESKKRSMYRKRYQMLDSMIEQMAAALAK